MRAVSTVTGSILLVAVTVALAGVIPAVLPSAQPSDPAPQARYDVTVTEYSGQPDEVTIRQIAGDTIDNDDLYVSISNTDVQQASGSPGPAERLSFSTLGDTGSEVTPADTIRIEPRDSTPDMTGRTVYIIYDDGDTEHLVATETID